MNIRETQDAAAVIAGWHDRPAPPPPGPLDNALTIDVEDYFQVEAFFDVINREDWAGLECRVERNIDLILDLLAGAQARATFFTLAWIAQRYPAMTRRIVDNGHELASHGLDHRRADRQSRLEFQADVIQARQTLEDLGGCAVKGYRAPSFSVMEQNLWALEALAEAGYLYSSSTYPISHDNYGIPSAPRFAFHPLPGQSFLEIPVTSTRWLGRNFPCGGGGYFRLLPYRFSAAALHRVNRREGRPCVFYFHPWELDPGQPRVTQARWRSKARHYLNLHRMQPRLRRLLDGFRWRRMDEIFIPQRTGES